MRLEVRGGIGKGRRGEEEWGMGEAGGRRIRMKIFLDWYAKAIVLASINHHTFLPVLITQILISQGKSVGVGNG